MAHTPLDPCSADCGLELCVLHGNTFTFPPNTDVRRRQMPRSIVPRMAKWTDTVKRVMDGDYQNAGAEERREAVRDLIQVCSVASSVLAIQPIPFLDAALMAPIQIAMIQGIGRVHGYSLDKKSI